jgi:hypothetical protein
MLKRVDLPPAPGSLAKLSRWLIAVGMYPFAFTQRTREILFANSTAEYVFSDFSSSEFLNIDTRTERGDA